MHKCKIKCGESCPVCKNFFPHELKQKKIIRINEEIHKKILVCKKCGYKTERIAYHTYKLKIEKNCKYWICNCGEIIKDNIEPNPKKLKFSQ